MRKYRLVFRRLQGIVYTKVTVFDMITGAFCFGTYASTKNFAKLLDYLRTK